MGKAGSISPDLTLVRDRRKRAFARLAICRFRVEWVATNYYNLSDSMAMTFTRRSASFIACAIALLMTAGIVMRPAGADELSDKRAEAQKIAARLSELDSQMMDVNAKYEAANFQLHQAEQQVSDAQALADQSQAEMEKRQSELKSFAVKAYMSGNDSQGFDAVITSSADEGTLSNSYLETLSGNRQDLVDALDAARAQAEADRTRLEQARAEAERSANEIEQAKSTAQAARNEQAALNSRVQGELTTLVQQEQEAQRARQAAAATSQRTTPSTGSGGGGTTPVVVNPPPANGSAASIAIQAMISQLGKPYVWGAAGPDAFDCSGLIAWAYAKAGVSLPHYSGAMYNMTTRISASQLQPGDLVFYGGGGSEHVAVYMGGGQLVHTFSPPTGVAVTQLDGWWKPPSGYGRLNS